MFNWFRHLLRRRASAPVPVYKTAIEIAREDYERALMLRTEKVAEMQSIIRLRGPQFVSAELNESVYRCEVSLDIERARLAMLEELEKGRRAREGPQADISGLPILPPLEKPLD